MSSNIQEKKFEIWQNGLLDVGKRNRMMNYRKTKRTTLQIVNPSMEELFLRLTVKEEAITFKLNVDTSGDPQLGGLLYLMERMNAGVEVTTGEIGSDQSVKEMNITLKNLRAKSRLSLEEQGINILYLSCGFLEWRQHPTDTAMRSPLVLIPVTLEKTSFSDCYKMRKAEEDIVINPTLEYVLHNDFNLNLPKMESLEENIMQYLYQVQQLVAPSGWKVIPEANLGLLSFLKIVMYKDLEKNKNRIFQNPVIKAICGDPSDLVSIPEEWVNANYDLTKPSDCFQVVSADASQQDAIMLSKKGLSFLLQGPPGTGKSQTITNIIAEGMADGKKILFVSEKMAALSVVYRRLQDVGLADYCLSLHNYKAEKKQVIQDLINTLDMPKREVRAGEEDFLSDLRKDRNKLNYYFKELQAVRQPLNKSLYQAITELSSMEDVPFYHVQEDTLQQTEADLKTRLTQLKHFQEFLENMDMSLEDNPWRGTSLKKLSFDKEQEIRSLLTSLGPELFNLSMLSDLLTKNYQIEGAWTWNRIQNLIGQARQAQLLEKIQGRIHSKIQQNFYFTLEALPASFAQDAQNARDAYEAYLAALEKQYAHMKENLNGGRMPDTTNPRWEDALYFSKEHGARARNVEAAIRQAANKLEEFELNPENCSTMKAPEELRRQQKLYDNFSEINQFLTDCQVLDPGITMDEAGVKRAANLVKILKSQYQFPTSLLSMKNYDGIRYNVNQMKQLVDNILTVRNRLSTDWSPEIATMNLNALQDRFNNDYKSMWKRMGGQYKKDKALLTSLRLNGAGKLDDDTCRNMLNDLANHQSMMAKFQNYSQHATHYFGENFQGLYTDWTMLFDLVDQGETANKYCQTYGLSQQGMALMGKTQQDRANHMLGSHSVGKINGSLLRDYVQLTGKMSGSIQYNVKNLAKIIQILKDLIQNYAATGIIMTEDVMVHTGGDVITLREDLAQVHILTYLRFVDKIAQRIDDLNQMMKNLEPFVHDIMISKCRDIGNKLILLDKCCTTMTFCQMMRQELMEDQKTQGIPYMISQHGETIYDLLEEYIEPETLEKTAQDFMAFWEKEDMTTEKAQVYMAGLAPNQEKWKTFVSYFPEEDLSNLEIHEAVNRVQVCQNLDHLRDWIDYTEKTEGLKRCGLEDYRDFVMDQGLAVDQIYDSYYRGFLTKWYYDVLQDQQLGYLVKFQDYAHENTIREFAALDQQQMKLAQARLAADLSQKKPSGINVMSNAMDEISILRKEGNKKRKIMPLRKLFKVIPNLLQKLKPCFMMSPLSVAYFLDSDMYEFDMVIFDEASQILPEDAIGAIYRGKQVIIVGDTKQMPPTSFFSAAAKNTDDYDDEEDDNYVDIMSESILDEADTCLPSCMLLWHYRSKDESLIAFSNQEIYNDRLITFPNCSKVPDRGLEYIYVADGYYEGKPKNCNIMEAKKCVELVAAHIQNHPNRSLGIIAFSEKQQGAIEDAILKWRLAHPEAEDFFREDKEEPFFVKNLENVQGDERDTIIFSICYARNKQGRMYMRFGPLGMAGGERRLNVAITRAKYNVKLVGSIYPNDLTINENTALGVRLLAKYIAYAMANDYSKPMGMEHDIREEAFADTVARFLVENGYKIRRNVGSSQYKLDIAVMHPGFENEFFAGIECDGTNYTMARTARDRDVTRRNIMSMMGWQMYHVWSVAWNKSPKQAQEKLLKFLEEALERYGREGVGEQPRGDDLPQGKDVEISDMTREFDTTTEVHTLKFPVYREAQLDAALKDVKISDAHALATLITYVMKVEAPIHKDLLYKRMAYVFGKQKATPIVIQSVDGAIENNLRDFMERRGDFWYMSEATEIRARVPASEAEKRPWDYICLEEIENAMVEILRLAYGLEPEELMQETARQFGFKKTGPKMKQRLQEIYEGLQSAGVLRAADNRVYLAEEV